MRFKKLDEIARPLGFWDKDGLSGLCHRNSVLISEATPQPDNTQTSSNGPSSISWHIMQACRTVCAAWERVSHDHGMLAENPHNAAVSSSLAAVLGAIMP